MAPGFGGVSGCAGLVLLAVVLCLGIFVQSAAGFAAGLLIVPLLLWSGFSIPEAQISLLVATIPQNLWGVWKFRGTIRPGEVAFPAVLRLLWLPLGVGALASLESLPSVRIRQVVGGVMLAVTLAIILWRPQPRERLHAGWSLLAFSTSGFLQGLVGMGGPAMVLWVQAHDWDTRRMRAFLFTMYLIGLTPAIFVLWWFFGRRLLVPGLTATALMPLLLAVTAVGLRTGTWLGRHRLRQVTLALLLLMGLAGVCTPLLSPTRSSTLTVPGGLPAPNHAEPDDAGPDRQPDFSPQPRKSRDAAVLYRRRSVGSRFVQYGIADGAARANGDGDRARDRQYCLHRDHHVAVAPG